MIVYGSSRKEDIAYLKVSGDCYSEVPERNIATGILMRANEKGVLVHVSITMGLIIEGKFLDKGGTLYDILSTDIDRLYKPGEVYVTELSRIHKESNKMIKASRLLPTLVTEFYIEKTAMAEQEKIDAKKYQLL
jgi:hypothetical protein